MTAESSNGDASPSPLVLDPPAAVPNPNNAVVITREDSEEENSYVFVATKKDHALADAVDETPLKSPNAANQDSSQVNAANGLTDGLIDGSPVKSPNAANGLTDSLSDETPVKSPDAVNDHSSAANGLADSLIDESQDKSPNGANDDSSAANGLTDSLIDVDGASPDKSSVDAANDDSSLVNAANGLSEDLNASAHESCVDFPNAANGDSTPVKACVDLPNAVNDDSNSEPRVDSPKAASDDSSPVKSCVDLPNAVNGSTDDSNASAHESPVDLPSGITPLDKAIGQDCSTATDLPHAFPQNGSLDSESAQATQPINADHVPQAEPYVTNDELPSAVYQNGNPPLHQHDDHHDTHSNLSPSPHEDNQDSEVQHSTSELAPNGLQSFESDSVSVPIDVRESSDACLEPREEDSASVGNKLSEADVCQPPQNDDSDGLPAATEASHENGTVEESAHQLVGPEIESNISPAVVAYEESEAPPSLLKSEVDLVGSAEPCPASDVTESSKDTLVPVTSESQADDSQSLSIDQQNHRVSDESLTSEESENSNDTHSELQPSEVQTHPVSRAEGEPTDSEELDSSQLDKSDDSVEVEAKVEQAHPVSLPEGGSTSVEELDFSQFDKNEETVEEDPVPLPVKGPTSLESQSEQRVEDEAKAELLPDADENQQTDLDLQESEAGQSDTVGSHEKGHLPAPASGLCVQVTKELSDSPDDGDKPSELDESLAHGDTVSVEKQIEINQAIQESGGEDSQHENLSPTDDVVDEASHSKTEAAGFSIQGVEKLSELEATAQDEIAVVNEVEVVELKTVETDIEATAQDETIVVNEDGTAVSALPENPEVADSSPVSNGREEGGVVLSEVVSVNDLGNGINTSPTDVATIEFGSLSYQAPSVNDTCEADSLDAPSSKVVKSSGMDCNDMTSDTVALASKLEVSDSSIVSEKNVINSSPEINGVKEEGDQLTVLNVQDNDKPVEKESEMVETPQSELSSASVVESSTSGSLAVQDVAARPVLRPPFEYVIRVSRFDELKERELKKQAEVQLQIDEKTKIRDAFRHECQKLEANRRGQEAEWRDARSFAKSSRELLKSKRDEIKSVQGMLNRVKNAMSIDDINARIKSWEYRMLHETISLNEEKQGMREIKQLKQYRQQLSSNIGNMDEVQKDINEREEIDMHFKTLTKELNHLKDVVVKAEAIAEAAHKKLEGETRKLNEVWKKFDEANEDRQSAYASLQSLKAELRQKMQPLYNYKDTARLARGVGRDRESLHHLCHDQVESVMKLYVEDNEFRKEYVKSNMRRTAGKFGTLDGRAPNPDEESPVLPILIVEKPERLVASQSNARSVVHTPSPKLTDETKTVVSIGDPSSKQNGEAKNVTGKNKGVATPKTSSAAAPSVKEAKDEIISEEAENIPTKEELESERKAELLRKEEEAAKLREQRRMEEKAKALEALERKKKNAEKAQQRAEQRALREAEQKEKEREKRMRKKEKKKAPVSEIVEEKEEACPETVKEAEALKEIKRGHKGASTSGTKHKGASTSGSKPSSSRARAVIPPPLRNRNRRRMHQWMWVGATCVVVIILFVMGNVGFFSNLSNLTPRRKNNNF